MPGWAEKWKESGKRGETERETRPPKPDRAVPVSRAEDAWSANTGRSGSPEQLDAGILTVCESVRLVSGVGFGFGGAGTSFGGSETSRDAAAVVAKWLAATSTWSLEHLVSVVEDPSERMWRHTREPCVEATRGLGWRSGHGGLAVTTRAGRRFFK